MDGSHNGADRLTAGEEDEGVQPACGTAPALSSALKYKFFVSRGMNNRDTNPTRVETSLRELYEEFKTPDTTRGKLSSAEYHALREDVKEEKVQRNVEKDGPYIIAGVFLAPETRRAEDLIATSGFICDLDSGRTDLRKVEEALKGTAFIAYTSYSHRRDRPKLRVVIPYAIPGLKSDVHAQVYNHFNGLFDGELDPNACPKPAQLYYTPACPRDAVNDYECVLHDGALFDPTTILTERVSASAGTAVVANTMQPVNFDTSTLTGELAKVGDALKFVGADTYDTWIRVGLALFNSFANLRDEASMLWFAWSRTSSKFDFANASKTWSSFKTRTDGAQITVASIFRMATDRGWKPTRLQEDWVAGMNDSYFVSRSGGKTLIYEEKVDPVTERSAILGMTRGDFGTWLDNRTITVIGANGKPASKPLAAAWLSHPDRRQYDGIVLVPNRDVPNYYNLWRGWGVELDRSEVARQRCRAIRRHLLYVLCKGNRAAYRYLLDWCAYAVQFPGRPGEVAVILKGGRGTGKGTFGQILHGIFGDHYLQISNSQHLTGNFNAHLRSCVMLFVDEAFWAGDRKGEGVLKGLITEPTIAIERKYHDVESVPNMLHIVMASNNDWVVPAGTDERRFFVLEVSDEHAQDHAYFAAVRAEMENGGVGALLDMLLSRDLARVNIREVPKTPALTEQKIRSFSTLERWLFDALKAGRLPHTENEGYTALGARHNWSDPISTEGVVKSYMQYARLSGDRYTNAATEVGMGLRKLIPNGLENPRVAVGSGRLKKRVRCYKFPSLLACRRAFEKSAGIAGFDWRGAV